MQWQLLGEMDIEVNGLPIHLAARGELLVFTLTHITTLAVAVRTLSHLPRCVGSKVSLTQLTDVCPEICVNLGAETILHIRRRDGVFSGLWRHHYSFKSKTLWLRNSFRLLRDYYS
ncbi:hypothetical protein [uncultured Photobacterium sp.]|uniref:hypothetical protein n=1 Tax=uncultured Photobacterium sp. TaxID=173973 RepID=UPI002621D29F|nr:hypothetical protein [uncultured Photobacterium sp.]